MLTFLKSTIKYMFNLNKKNKIASASYFGFAMTSLRGGTTKQSNCSIFNYLL